MDLLGVFFFPPDLTPDITVGTGRRCGIMGGHEKTKRNIRSAFSRRKCAAWVLLMSMCFPLGCQVQISSPTEMCFFFFFSNSRSSCDTATGVALYMTGKLAFVHKQDLQINKLCDCKV